jgi:demethylspheroidene O-methyltransferase
MTPPELAHPMAEPAGTWRERFLAWRDRTVASRRFQRWAAAFPLTRPVAQRRARELFDLVAGFVYSQVLLACVRLRLFDILAEGPQTLAQLARRLALPEDAAQRLLAAAVSLRLLERRSGGRFGLGPLGAPMVGNQAIAAMVEHHATLYADLRDPVALLRGESASPALAGYWPYASTAAGAAPATLSADRVAEYSALMSASQPLVAEQVFDAYPLARHRCLLDVGGGEGTFLIAAAPQAPTLRLMLFDLPAVAERARQRFADLGLAGRASAFGGSFFDDDLPGGADVATLVRVLFDHPDERALKILRAVHRALPPGGTLLVAEPMSATPGAEAMGDAYFGFYLLAMGRGRPRSAADLTALLHAAGFEDAHLLPTRMPLQTGLIVARRGMT